KRRLSSSIKMLQSWANYLLGAVVNRERPTAVGVSEAQELHPRLTSVEAGDWVVIQRDIEDNSNGASSTESSNSYDEFRQRVLSTSSHLTRTSSSSSLPSISINMEESWFLTPPPCFNSTGPVHMETSPLENLLIEHPSMSVYQHSPHLIYQNIQRRNAPPSFLSISGEADVEVDDLEVEDVEDEMGEQVAIIHRRPRRHGAHFLQLQELQYSKSKQAQKVQIRKSSQPLKKTGLERNNKAREVNCRNRRQRRGERSQGLNRSHANNNRKC
ncbi:hypothetical protein WA026_013834, partial [Henosepilachna vigintioctopunctata]